MTTFGTYRIPKDNLPELTSRLDKLNKRANKLGVTPVTFQVVDTELEQHTCPSDWCEWAPWDDEKRECYNVGQVRVWQHVSLFGETPKLNGWVLAATVEHTPEGNMVRTVPGQSVDLKYREGAAYCAHCKLIRNRRDTFIVKHEDGREAEVGSDCIKDFLGHADPHRMAAWAEALGAFDVVIRNLSEYGNEPIERRTVDATAFLWNVCAVVREKGWLSRSKARENRAKNDGEVEADGRRWLPEEATADRAIRNMYPTTQREREERIEITDEDKETAENIMQWAEETLQSVDPYSLNDYLHNLRIATAQHYLEYRDLGIFASVVVPYRTAKAIHEEYEARPESKPIGEVGKRGIFNNMKVMRIIDIETQFGLSILYRFSDEAGNVMTWFSSGGRLRDGKDWNAPIIDEGDVVNIKVTVKEHAQTKYTKGIETKVNRVALVKLVRKAETDVE